VASLRLVDGAYSRFDGKPVVIIRDPEHHLLAQLAAWPVTQAIRDRAGEVKREPQ
jgi:hypothetical protein